MRPLRRHEQPLRGHIVIGETIVLPLTTSQIAIGTCTRGYSYDAAQSPDKRHIPTGSKFTPGSRGVFSEGSHRGNDVDHVSESLCRGQGEK
jgi:hypothetical protein